MKTRTYLGTPYAARGLDLPGAELPIGPGSPGLNCWDLLRSVSARELGLELPSYAGDYIDAGEAELVGQLLEGRLAEGNWVPVARPMPGDGVTLWVRRPGLVAHVGLYVGAGRMLNVLAPSRARPHGTGARIDSLRAGFWSTRVLGYWRHRSRSAPRDDAILLPQSSNTPEEPIATDRWRMTLLGDPFSLRHTTVDVAVGTSIAAALRSEELLRLPDGELRVLLAGTVVPAQQEWNGRTVDVLEHLRPKGGELVVVRSLPQDAVSISALLIALGKAAAAAVPGGAAIAGGVGGAAAAAAIGAGISIGTVFVIEGAVTLLTGLVLAGGVFAATSALTGFGASVEPNAGGGGGGGPQSSPTSQGIGNELRPFEVIPTGFGHEKVYPPFGAPPYTELIYGHRYWRVLLVVGSGRYRLRDPATGRPRIFLGDFPVDEVDGVRYEIREGGRVVATDLPTFDPWQNYYSRLVLEQDAAVGRPAAYWRLGDAIGATFAVNAIQPGDALTVGGTVTFGEPAALWFETDTCARLAGSDRLWAVGGPVEQSWAIEAWIWPDVYDATRRCVFATGRFATGISTSHQEGASGVRLYQRNRALILSVRTVRRSIRGNSNSWAEFETTYENVLPPTGVAHVVLAVESSPVGLGGDRRARFRLTAHGQALAPFEIGYEDDNPRVRGDEFPSTVSESGRPFPGGWGPRGGEPPVTPADLQQARWIPPRDIFAFGQEQGTDGSWGAGFVGRMDELAFYAPAPPPEVVSWHYEVGSGLARERSIKYGPLYTLGADFSLFGDSVHEVQINETLEPASQDHAAGKESEWIPFALSGDRTTQISVDLYFPTGLWRVNEDGKDKDTTVGIELEFRLRSDPNGWRRALDQAGFRRTHPKGFSQTTNLDIDTSTPTKFGREIIQLRGEMHEAFYHRFEWEVAQGAYLGRIRRVETEGPNHRGGSDTSAFGSTFMVLAARAVELGTAPLRVNGLATIGLWIPFDAVGGNVQKIAVEYERMLRIYDPADPEADAQGWTPYRATRNAADAALACLTDPDITPEPHADDEVDRDAFLELRATAEDFNLYIDFASNVRDLVRLILAPSMAELDDVGDGQVTVFQDKAGQQPIALISPLTAKGFRSLKRFPELPHALRVTFRDAEDGWSENQLVVYDDGYSERGPEAGKPETTGTDPATSFEVVTVRGLTTRERVQRYQRKRIVAARLRSEEFSCEVWLDQIAYSRGSVVEFAHPTAVVGDAFARVVDVERNAAGAVTRALLSDEVPYVAGRSYAAVIALAGANLHLAATNPGAPSRYVTFATPIGGASQPGKGTHVTVGEAGIETMLAVVREIHPRIEDLVADVVLIPYAPEIHTAGDGVVAYQPPISRPSPRPELETPPAPRISRVESDERWLIRGRTGLVTRARVSVLSPLSSRGDALAVRARARRIAPQGPWRVPGAWSDPGSGICFVEGLEDGKPYRFAAQAQARLGNTSPWGPAVQRTILGQTSPPPAPTNLRAERDRLTWEFPDGQIVRDFDGFEVRYAYGNRPAGEWLSGIRAHQARRLYQTEIAIAELPRSFGLTLWVVAFDLLGNPCVAPPALWLELGDPPANVLRESDEAAAGWPGTIEGGHVAAGHLVSELLEEAATGTASLDAAKRRATLTSSLNAHALRVGDFFYFDADELVYASRIAAIDYAGAAIDLEFPYEGATTSGACTIALSAWGPDDRAPAWDTDDAVPAWGPRSHQLVYIARALVPALNVETGRELRLSMSWEPATVRRVLQYRELGPGPAWGPDNAAPAWGPNDSAPAWASIGAWLPWPGSIVLKRVPYGIRALIFEHRKGATALKACTLRIDIDDREERLDDVVVGPLGLYLPLATDFRVIKGIRVTVQSVPGQAATGYRISGRAQARPFVETVPVGSTGTYDFVVEGY